MLNGFDGRRELTGSADELEIRMKKLVLIVALLVSFTSSELAWAGEAGDQLKKSIDKIIGLVSDPELKAPEMRLERRNRIFKVVEERFDFTEMARRSLGESWQDLSEDEQTEFEVAFARLLENSYITKIEKYKNEEVKFSNEKAKGDRYVYISTEIISDRQSIPVRYSMHRVDGQWLVYDVNIEGVSLISNYRAQFKEAMRREGFKQLLTKLNEKLKKLDENS